ncbi:MAG: hypothetical protein C0465_25890, partial [Ralstonia sp.]|uniref:hypothetical protein n=1 Tax=Ralstonia sp. TaxID=54061 RepID=UPI00257DCB7F
FGHRDVRKVSRSSAGAEAYIISTLASASATDIVWESNRTYCTALARVRGPQGGFELVSYSIEEHAVID